MISDSLRSSVSLDVSLQLVELTKELEKLGLYCDLDRKLACIMVWPQAIQKGQLPPVIVFTTYDDAGAPFIDYDSLVKDDDESIAIWKRGSILYKAYHIKALVEMSSDNPKVNTTIKKGEA